eukprot:SAG11_NODE_47_length_20431_cov_7.472752_25_plen_51_part_00
MERPQESGCVPRAEKSVLDLAISGFSEKPERTRASTAEQTDAVVPSSQYD